MERIIGVCVIDKDGKAGGVYSFKPAGDYFYSGQTLCNLVEIETYSQGQASGGWQGAAGKGRLTRGGRSEVCGEWCGGGRTGGRCYLRASSRAGGGDKASL